MALKLPAGCPVDVTNVIGRLPGRKAAVEKTGVGADELYVNGKDVRKAVDVASVGQ